MMDGAYFTSRKEILDFFNSLLSMNLSKIEQTASGAVACQLMDYMFPGSIPMKRINWEAKSDFQFIENYKLLQAAFTKKKVQKMVDVDRLIRGKYQDNLEHCQWLKAFFEHASSDSREDYDALARRQMGKGGKNLDAMFLPRGMNMKAGGRGRVASSSAPTSTGAGSSSTRSRSSVKSHSRASSVTSKSRSMAGKSTSKPTTPLRDKNSRPSAKQTISGAAAKKVQQLESENQELAERNSELKKKNAEAELILENIEKERDFYFEKLRGIEVMLQVHEEEGEASDAEALIQRTFKVLYAKIEDNILVTDDGELLEDIANGGESGEDLLNISMLSTTDPVEDLQDLDDDESLPIQIEPMSTEI